LDATLNGEVLSAQLKFTGEQPSQGGYHGNLTDLKLATAEFGTWALRQAAAVTLD
jgi:hypothetical protein